MKAAETKPSAKPASKSTPFFSKESGSDFFSGKSSEGAFFTNSTTPTAIQPKLTIGQPNDKYEQEADAMADKVVQRLAENETNQSKHSDTLGLVSPLLQTKCAACDEEKKLQRKEDDKLHLDKKLQRKPVLESKEAKRKNEGSFQKKTVNSPKTASPPVESQISSLKRERQPFTRRFSATAGSLHGG